MKREWAFAWLVPMWIGIGFGVAGSGWARGAGFAAMCIFGAISLVTVHKGR